MQRVAKQLVKPLLSGGFRIYRLDRLATGGPELDVGPAAGLDGLDQAELDERVVATLDPVRDRRLRDVERRSEGVIAQRLVVLVVEQPEDAGAGGLPIEGVQGTVDALVDRC